MKFLFNTSVITAAVLLSGSLATAAASSNGCIRNGELDQWTEGNPLGWKVGEVGSSKRWQNYSKE
ncbi:MAG: hypothetical protein U9N87_12180 [Planctomycetota bacterium]|nr:hypothetical protein [Planctomycetota bacterium]